MANFRCPSASLSSTSSTQNAQSKASKLQKPHAAPRRIRSVNIAKAKVAAKNAARLARARRIQLNPADGNYGLFVGNFPPDAEKQELEAHFRRCGKITSTDIRCCGGVCTPTKRAPEGYYLAKRVRQYAFLTFATQLARSKALRLAGSILRDFTLVVSLSISDLPELREMITDRMNNYRSKFVTPDVHRAKKSVLKSLDLEPTILLDPNQQQRDRKRANAVIFDHTFNMAIM